MHANTGLPPPPPRAAPVPGLIGALRQAGDGLIATVQDRVALVSLEVQEEKARLLRVHLWLSLALGTGLLALTFASLAVVYLLRHYAPLAALLGFTLLYAAACGAVVAGLRRLLRDEPRPFAASLEELEKDRACLRPDHP
jgi:uncharacterized membrane protein YqjE